MVLLLLLVSVVLFVLADIGVREVTKSLSEKAKRREREEALAVSLKLDVSREAKTLKRAEVKDPAARILCVDDEDVILDSFRKILVLDGYAVDTVQTGQEALGLVQTHHYDFVFTDLKMPAMDGVDVVKAVKHMRPDIDVIVITGFATVETAVECMKFGATDYVQKPFTEDELLAFVKKTLIRRQDRIAKLLKPSVHVSHLPEADRVRRSEFSIPGGVFIAPGHTWAAVTQEGAVKVGMDDFAKKLLGPVDGIEFPPIGMTVRAGQPLFVVRQKKRRVQFGSPISGRVTKTNTALAEDPEALEMTPYAKNWVCIIDAEKLDVEVPQLKIGKAAVALFEEDIDRFRTTMKGMLGDAATGTEADDLIYRGELGQLTDDQSERVAKEFFAR
ncbi:MAG: response regulator [Gemmatimonadaceae bacterium]|nr:response regulator [Gemmatimonadaceae bacterium]